MTVELPTRFDERLYVRIDHGMPENPKVVGLSDAAFRMYVEAICWCSRQRTNGIIPAAMLRKLGSAKAAKELQSAGLLDPVGEDWTIHDYLMHQRSAGEIDKLRVGRSDAGTLGAHSRWHIAKRKYSKDCPHCVEEGLVAAG